MGLWLRLFFFDLRRGLFSWSGFRTFEFGSVGFFVWELLHYLAELGEGRVGV